MNKIDSAGTLVVTLRERDEVIQIGDGDESIFVTIKRVKGLRARLMIICDKSVRVERKKGVWNGTELEDIC